MAVRITILGSGTSHGVPMIGCDCPVCTSEDPRDRRTRCSAVLAFEGFQLLVDTSPELRLQCVACGIRSIQAVWYTHAHADHVAGLDDLRRFNWLANGPLPVYGSEKTLASVGRMFPYAFAEQRDYPSAIPTLQARVLDGPIELGGRQVAPIDYPHGQTVVTGLRVGAVAYVPDCNHLPGRALESLRDLDILVLDALRRRPHPTHFNLEQAIEVAERIGAQRTYFTHIAHELGHAQTDDELPGNMRLAYDGLVCESD